MIELNTGDIIAVIAILIAISIWVVNRTIFKPLNRLESSLDTINDRLGDIQSSLGKLIAKLPGPSSGPITNKSLVSLTSKGQETAKKTGLDHYAAQALPELKPRPVKLDQSSDVYYRTLKIANKQV